MGWNKDGSTVKAMYLSEYPCVGVVKESRVKYGGKVGYWLDLVEPLYLHNGEQRTTVMVNEDQLVADFGVIEA
jgi:hypothetical protein